MDALIVETSARIWVGPAELSRSGYPNVLHWGIAMNACY